VKRLKSGSAIALTDSSNNLSHKIDMTIMPNIYIIGGPKGADKTTVFLRLLPNFLECFEYVNADAIAAGMSLFNPESVAILAGRLMIERLRSLSYSGTDSAFETTLADRNFARFLRNCKTKGYTINLIYFWLQSPEIAIERVQRRVESGGHSLGEIDITSIILVLR
jgi:predicted ABC-type ATPase